MVSTNATQHTLYLVYFIEDSFNLLLSNGFFSSFGFLQLFVYLYNIYSGFLFTAVLSVEANDFLDWLDSKAKIMIRTINVMMIIGKTITAI